MGEQAPAHEPVVTPVVSPIAAVILFAVTSLSPAPGPQVSNPPRSIPPTTAFVIACEGVSRPTPSCTTAALENIDAARATEGLKPLRLPTDYAGLLFRRQLVLVTDAERSARGLRSLAENPQDDQLAKTGAYDHTDPIGPPGRSWGSNWAGVADPLAADYLWMYDDGPDSPNADCPRAGAPGCWGHRDNILGRGWTSMGAGHDLASVTELFVG